MIDTCARKGYDAVEYDNLDSGTRVIAIEYRRRDFRATCRAVGDRISVVLRNRNVSEPGTPGYRYDAC